MFPQVKSKYFKSKQFKFLTHRQTHRHTNRQTDTQTHKQTDRQGDRQTAFYLMTLWRFSFSSWRKKADSKSVNIASFAALTEEDINIIRQRGFNIV